MKNKFLAVVSAVSAVALVSGILVVTANAHIGASHSPYNTDGPDLISATVTGDETVSYCFDEDVADEDANDDVTQYELRGFGSDQVVSADDSDLGTADECVDISFDTPQDKDVEDYTVALIEAGEAETRDGDASVAGAVALTGSTAPGEETPFAGHDGAPNLTDWTAHTGSNTISYTFDETLDCDALTNDASLDDDTDAENFGFYEEDEATGGAATNEDVATNEDPEIALGDNVVDCDDNEVEVQFSIAGGPLVEATGDTDKLGDRAIDDNGGANEDVGDAEKVWVSGNSAHDVGFFGDDSATGATAASGDVCDPDTDDDECLDTEMESSDEDINDAPDLTDVERTDDTAVTYTFDENIDDTSSAIEDDLFYIAYEDGFQTFAVDLDCDADGKTVECDFKASGPSNLDEIEDNEIPIAGVGDCAVHTDDSNPEDEEACSTIGAAPLTESTEDAGFTDAPDLEDCDLDVAGEQAVFFFDEDIDEDTLGTPDGSDFYVFDAGADETNGDSGDVDDVEDNTVTVDFENEDLSDQVGCGIEEGIVADDNDDTDNDNVAATVGTAPASSAAPSTATATSTSTTTVTTGTGHTPVTRKIATNLTIRYDKDAHAFKGSVGSSKKKCQTGRLVTLKKRHAGGQGSDSSNRKGNYLINKRKASGKFFTKVSKKVFTAKNGDTIVCKTDTSPTIKV
jgi:hypothetical protein